MSLRYGGCKNDVEDPYQNGIKVASACGPVGKSLLKPNQSKTFLPDIRNQNNAVVVKKLALGGQSKYSQQLNINFKPKDHEEQRSQFDASQTQITVCDATV